MLRGGGGGGGGGAGSSKEHKGIFWDDENALYLDWGSVYRGVYTSVRTQTVNLRFVYLTLWKLSLYSKEKIMHTNWRLQVSEQTAKELEITAYVKRIIQEIPCANVNFTNKKSGKRELE